MIWKSPKVGTALQTEWHSTLHHPTAYKSDRDLMWESHNHHIDKKQIRCFHRGMICSWLLRYMSNFFAYYASPTSQRKCKCDDRFIVWRYDALCDPKSILNYCIATRNIHMPWSKFSSKPKEKEIFCICHVFPGSPEHRETVDTFWVAQHCLDNTEGGISQRTENGYFLLVQTLGVLPSLSDSYTLSSQEHTEYWVKRQTWGYAYVKKLSLGNISSSKHWRVQSVSSG